MMNIPGLLSDEEKQGINNGAMLNAALALIGNRSGRGLAGAANAAAGGLGAYGQAQQQGLRGVLQTREMEARLGDQARQKAWGDAYLKANLPGRIQLLEDRAAQAAALGQDKMAEALMKQAESFRKRAGDEEFGRAVAPQSVSTEQALAAGGGPTPQAAAMQGQAIPTDWAALTRRFPGRIDEIKKMAEAGTLGMPEVARTVEVMGADGKPQTMQLDRFGRPVGSAMDKPFELRNVDTGGQIRLQNPYTGAMGGGVNKSMTPDGAASNALGWANYGLARDRLNQERPNTQVINDPERGPMIVDKSTGLGRPVVGLDGKPVATEGQIKRENAANALLPVLKEAEKLIPAATGSFIGAGADLGARVFGGSTSGAQSAAKLKVLEGQIIMSQPRMEGSQSNADTMLYRQMAAQIGDDTVPAATKAAALDTLRKLHEKYAPGGGQGSATSVPFPTIDDITKELTRRGR